MCEHVCYLAFLFWSSSVGSNEEATATSETKSALGDVGVDVAVSRYSRPDQTRNPARPFPSTHTDTLTHTHTHTHTDTAFYSPLPQYLMAIIFKCVAP